MTVVNVRCVARHRRVTLAQVRGDQVAPYGVSDANLPRLAQTPACHVIWNPLVTICLVCAVQKVIVTIGFAEKPGKKNCLKNLTEG